MTIGFLLMLLQTAATGQTAPTCQTAATGDRPAWSTAALVRQGRQPIVRFQARIDGDYLFVRARHEREWHTYAMDNATRSEKALQGKMSLGVEQGIEIKAKSGLELDNLWRQTTPLDLSKPVLRWYSYGFENTAVFACRVKSILDEPIVLQIRGQACSGETCCKIDVLLELKSRQAADDLTANQAERLKTALKKLVPVEIRPVNPTPPS